MRQKSSQLIHHLRVVTQGKPEECALELLLERESEHSRKRCERVGVLGHLHVACAFFDGFSLVSDMQTAMRTSCTSEFVVCYRHVDAPRHIL